MSRAMGTRARTTVRVALLLLLSLAALPAVAQNFYEGLPAPLQRIAIEQMLGEQVDMSLAFTNEAGERVTLGDLTSDRPIILALVYYDCPMLCSLTLNGVVSSLKAVELDAGRDFEVVVVSIDPGEGPQLASATKARVVDSYKRAGTENGWHFLVGDQPEIDSLTEAVGFRYSYDEETGEYAHAAGIIILTPEGRVSRYLLGIEYPAKDVRLSLVESSNETIGTLVDQALLFCYRYDPETGTYSAATMNLVRLGGALTVLLIVIFIVLMLRRDRQVAPLGEPEHVA